MSSTACATGGEARHMPLRHARVPHVATSGVRADAKRALMSQVAFGLLWSFVFVLPWEEVIRLPLLGSIPRLVAVVTLVVSGLFILARGRVRPPAAFQLLALAFVLWAGLS